MEDENADVTREPVEEQPMADAPSPRARALREKILGSALTLDEAAYVLSLDRTTVAKYLRENTLFGFQIGREWRIPEEELGAYVRRMIEGQWGVSAIGPRVRIKETSPEEGRGFLDRIRYEFTERRKPGKEERGEMSARFDKFTRRARRVLTLAQEEAVRLQHNYIGTEHLLLGLIREGDGVAAHVLTDLGVELGKARGAVERVIGRGDHVTGGEVGLTPRAKKVIELAVDEARRLGHHYIGTEHLLLGLIREGEGVAAGVLESLDVSLERARERTLEILGGQYARQVDEGETPPVPAEAATLLAEGEDARTCPRCAARCPTYFRHCFNCGERLEGGA